MKKRSSLVSMNRSELLMEVRKLRRQLKSLDAAKSKRTTAVEIDPKEENYRILLNESSDPTFIVQADGTCVYANKVFADCVGRKLNRIIGRRIWELFGEKEANLPAIVKWVIENQETKVMDTRVAQKDDVHYYISTANPVFNKENDLAAIICISKEITSRKRIEDELRYIISHDTLTGLYNRNFFQTELQRIQHSRQFPVSVIMLDVDRLDTLNHQYGRKTGDAILVKVGTILKETFRTEEIIARIGGDEFAVLLPETGETELSDIVARLNKDIDKAQDPLLKLTLSLATAKEGDSLTELMEQAENRLFQNKNILTK